MSLTASMWTSVSGLLAHGERMNVVGNNISNVNTVAFKNQRMDFQDFVYQSIGTVGGVSQVGMGTSIGAIMNDFSQGSFETSTNSTDIAISGNGFFMVKPVSNNQSFYTRAGNFRFNKDGYLVDPHGYVLQGWNVTREADFVSKANQRNSSGIIGSGSPTDIKLDTFTCAPRHTSNVTLSVNLPNAQIASTDDNSLDATDPFFSLLKKWNASQQTALAQSAYEAQSTMTVYDEGGRAHKLTIYFDRVANNNPATIDGYTDSESYWEYIVTMDPSEDVRDFSSTYDPNIPPATSPDVPDKLKGLLGAGTLTFSSSGILKDMTAFVPHTNGSDTDHWWTTSSTGEVDVNLDKWIAAPFDSNGYPMFAPNFSGAAGMSQAYRDGIWNQPNANAAGRMISFDLGLRSKTNSWQFVGDPNGKTPGTYMSSGLVAASGLKQTGSSYQQQNSKYVWDGSGVALGFPGSGPNVTKILTPSTTKPVVYGSTWSPAVPSSNGTDFTWDVTVTGANENSMMPLPIHTGSDVDPTKNASVESNRANPDNALHRGWTANIPGVTAVIYRNLDTDRAFTPSEFAKGANDFANWTHNDPNSQYAATAAALGLDWYTAPDGESVIYCPSTVTRDQLMSASWADTPGTPSAGVPTQFNWIVNFPNGSPSSVNLTSATNTPPQITKPAPQTDAKAADGKAIEYYWRNDANPDIIMVTDGVGAVTPDYPMWTPHTATNWMDSLGSAPENIGTDNTNKYFLNGMDGSAQLEQTSSTCHGDNFYELNGLKQDGYTYGNLSTVFVSPEGVLSATYSNGVTLQLFQIVLYDFPSPQNLRREGGNLFSETRESGLPSSGAAGTGPFGTTQGNALEQSNVDLAREFVNMITTQRGFQANSKNITTVDTMLETVIGMKR